MYIDKDINGNIYTGGDLCKFTTINNEELKGVLKFSLEELEFGFETVKGSSVPFVLMADVKSDSIEVLMTLQKDEDDKWKLKEVVNADTDFCKEKDFIGQPYDVAFRECGFGICSGCKFK